jgi:hypothetical protein
VIPGVYDEPSGAFLRAAVYFRPPINKLLLVPFLVDTGATRTHIAFDDLEDLGDSINLLVLRSGQPVRGIGGETSGATTPVAMVLRHIDAAATMFGLRMPLLTDRANSGLPSILGRDILFRGHLRLDPSAGLVYFDPPVGSFML